MAPPSNLDHSSLVATVLPDLINFNDVLRCCSLAHRSAIIKCCQAQCVPTGECTLNTIVSELPDLAYRNSIKSTRRMAIPFKSVLNTIKQHIESPIGAAFILDLCRSAPLPLHEIWDARAKSWGKEMKLCEQFKRVEAVNWMPIFDPANHRDEPMLPGIPANPTMALAIHSSLRFWKLRKCSNRLLFPRATKKNMSRDTRREYEQYMKVSLELVPIFSQYDFLYHYHHTGHVLGGASEMRQKWYPSGAKPRTYYAQGGTHYSRSCYLQDIFSDLVNSSPITHHVSRLQPGRLSLPIGSHYFVYDLSSFTSNMAEQKNFVKHLADFCMDVSVNLFDLHDGVLEGLNLGDLLHEYNEVCNFSPAVSYERSNNDWDIDNISEHGTASMLGIFGNLMTCTFAHGALVAQTVQTENEINVAGDDAQVKETEENSEHIDFCVCALGSYERSKSFRSNEEGCICLKRPLYESFQTLEQGIVLIPPSLTLILHYIFHVPDERYTFHDDVPDWIGISIVGRDWMRYLRSVYRACWKLTDLQVEEALSPFQKLTRLIHAPLSGFMGLMTDPYFWPPCMTVESIRETDPLEALLLNRWMGYAIIPVCRMIEPVETIDRFNVGEIFESNSTRVLVLAEEMGYLEREKKFRSVEGAQGLLAVRHLLTNYEPAVYEYTVINPVPNMFSFSQ